MIADIGIAIRTILLADADVSAMTTRVYSDHMPQTVNSPAIVFWTIYSNAIDCIDGPTGFEQATVQMECYGNTRSEATQLFGVMTKAIAGFRGMVTVANGEDVLIRSVSQTSGQRHRQDKPEAGSDQYRYVAMQDLLFSYHAYQKA